MSDINSYLNGGGGAPSAFNKDSVIGQVVKGQIVSFEEKQQTTVDGDPKVWPRDGKPMMEWVITLATAERDPSKEEDNGERRLFVRYKLRDAIGAAVKAAKAELAVGGTLAVQYSGQESLGGGKHANLYVAEYAAPTVSAGSLLGTSEPAPAAEAPAPAVAAASILG